MKHLAVLLCITALTACAGTDRSAAVVAVQSPLTDLNLVRPDIPHVLRVAEKAPFAIPTDVSCPALAAAVVDMEKALGMEKAALDDEDPDLLERGKTEVSKAAVNAVRSAAEDVVPFRKWVRKLTGAERRSKDLASAIAAGYARRAYLKGFAHGKGCQEEVLVQASE